MLPEQYDNMTTRTFLGKSKRVEETKYKNAVSMVISVKYVRVFGN